MFLLKSNDCFQIIQIEVNSVKIIIQNTWTLFAYMSKKLQNCLKWGNESICVYIGAQRIVIRFK